MSEPIKLTAEMTARSGTHYRPETRLIHSGTLRSQFGETSEALFLTQGYVYDNSAANVRNPFHPPQRIAWGQNTNDEMGDLWVQLVPRDDRQFTALSGDVEARRVRFVRDDDGDAGVQRACRDGIDQGLEVAPSARNQDPQRAIHRTPPRRRKRPPPGPR